MIVYMDRTFCINHECPDRDRCARYYTDAIHKEACMWWGNDSPPVSVMMPESNGCVFYMEATK
jgi:hypothetical protein